MVMLFGPGMFSFLFFILFTNKYTYFRFIYCSTMEHPTSHTHPPSCDGPPPSLFKCELVGIFFITTRQWDTACHTGPTLVSYASQWGLFFRLLWSMDILGQLPHPCFKHKLVGLGGTTCERAIACYVFNYTILYLCSTSMYFDNKNLLKK